MIDRAIHLEDHMKQLTADQIDTLRDLVQAEIKDIKSGTNIYASPDELAHLTKIDAQLLDMYDAARGKKV